MNRSRASPFFGLFIVVNSLVADSAAGNLSAGFVIALLLEGGSLLVARGRAIDPIRWTVGFPQAFELINRAPCLSRRLHDAREQCVYAGIVAVHTDARCGECLAASGDRTVRCIGGRHGRHCAGRDGTAIAGTFTDFRSGDHLVQKSIRVSAGG